MNQKSNWKNRIIGRGEEPLDNILFNPSNWRIHPKAQQDVLEGVLSQVGWVQDVIVNKRTGHLVDGHLRCQVAARNNEKTVPVVYVDLSEEEENLILASLDPIAAMAATDKTKLDELLQSIKSDDERINDLLSKIAKKENLGFGQKELIEDVEPKIDKAEELRIKWGVESGQLWELGDHRLICGDCTDKAVIATVIGDEKVHVCLTDPPYKAVMSGAGLAIDCESVKQWENYGSGKDFDLLDFGSDFNKILFSFCDNLLFLVTYNQVHDLISEAKQRKMKHRILPICKKLSPFPSSGNWAIDMNWGVHIYNNPRGSSNNRSWTIINQSTDVEAKKKVEHPSPYKLDLINNFIEIVSLFGDKILDPFVGSGTTIIACESSGRKCRAIEISPAYCAVTIQRWVDVTGKKPKLLQNLPPKKEDK